MSMTGIPLQRKKPLGIDKYEFPKFNHNVDTMFGTAAKNSRWCHVKSYFHLNEYLSIKKIVPPPNLYPSNSTLTDDNCKLYAHDRNTSFSEHIRHEKKRGSISPNTYTPGNPFYKVRGSLKQSEHRLTPW